MLVQKWRLGFKKQLNPLTLLWFYNLSEGKSYSATSYQKDQLKVTGALAGSFTTEMHTCYSALNEEQPQPEAGMGRCLMGVGEIQCSSQTLFFRKTWTFQRATKISKAATCLLCLEAVVWSGQRHAVRRCFDSWLPNSPVSNEWWKPGQ